MKPPCEIIANEILPAVRALTAKKLIEGYGFSQKKTAILMGLTQPAVSQYKRNLRGYKIEPRIKSPEIEKMIDNLAKGIASGISIEEQTLQFHNICKTLCKEGIMCEIHKKMEPSLENCKICMNEF